ncbi:hypothetical protein [Streptomyces sp. NBC_01373]|uniref:hypothetical protein n=1 Tax=Streptomyces sp. NBC_01373 TaxID=2903843 RepID=UPI00225A541F|nr:hypothetical protein [Streptomyces sp. NBC_01373]MCX4699019.1 hypothetical protein [Streptomyces sp. NBC_01373]
MTDDTTHPRPLCVGYLRLRFSDDDQSEQQHVAAIAALAEREGFTLSLLFVETRWQRALALNAMTAHCQQRAIRHVIVPNSDHLNTLPSLAYLSKNLLQQDIGGQVWIVRPDTEESSCSPTTSRGEP